MMFAQGLDTVVKYLNTFSNGFSQEKEMKKEIVLKGG